MNSLEIATPKSDQKLEPDQEIEKEKCGEDEKFFLANVEQAFDEFRHSDPSGDPMEPEGCASNSPSSDACWHINFKSLAYSGRDFQE